MSTDRPKKSPFPSAHDTAKSAQLHIDSPQCRSASYRLAFQDPDLLLRDELRPVRLQLEVLKPELVLQEQHIESTVVVYGSARIPDPETAESRLVSAQAEYAKNNQDPGLKKKVAPPLHAVLESQGHDVPVHRHQAGPVVCRPVGLQAARPPELHQPHAVDDPLRGNRARPRRDS